MITLATLKAQEVLTRYTDNFQRDFDFDDVVDDVRRYVLTDTECADILSHTQSVAEQIDKLIFVLSTSAHKLGEFINAIEEKYCWLAQRMRSALLDDSKDDELELMRQQIQELRSQIPRLEAFNVQRKHYLFDIHQQLKTLQAGECLMLTGDLVYGKKWLAIDACSNYGTMELMGGRIYLVNLDKCQTNEEILERMVLLYSMLNPSNIASLPAVYDDSTTNKIHMLKRILADELLAHHRDALLVLCDVQCPRALSAFKLHCKCMLTTRNKAILDEWPAHLRRDRPIECGFTKAETLALFARVLGTTERALPAEAQSIHERCAGSPFIVSLVASNLKDYKMTDRRWKNWVKMLDKNESTSNESFRIIIWQSLTDLPEEYEQLFHSLAIFGDNIKIPLSLLQAYWQKSESEVEQIVRKFDRLYLVETVTLPAASGDPTADVQMFCLLKYHYCSYLSNELTETEKLRYHNKLLISYDIPCGIADFADSHVLQRLDDRYFYFYIGHHLRKAGWLEAFGSLFLNLSFLEQKLRATGLPNTIGDLHTYRVQIINETPGRQPLFNDLLEFLPNVEEMLKKCADTTLLQYALNTTGALRAEAARQADAFPQRCFFAGSDHINRHRRQIVALPRRPTFIRFCGPNTALIALDNHTIFLADLSPGYTVQPSLFAGHKAAIVDIQMLGCGEFVSLDAAGTCLVWSLESAPIHRKRSSSYSAISAVNVSHRSSGSTSSYHGAGETDTTDGDTDTAARNGIRQTRAESFDKHAHRHTYTQTINVRTPSDRIRCMSVVRTLDRRPSSTGSSSQPVGSVIFGTAGGQLLVYAWSGTELQNDIDLSTTMGDIRAIQQCAPQQLLVLAASGALWLYNTKTSAARPLLATTRPATTQQIVSQLRLSSIAAAAPDDAIGLHTLSEQSYAASLKRTANQYVAAVVFSDRVERVHIETGVQALRATVATTTLFASAPTDCNRITCSVLSDDRGYLVLGTERGVIVLDVRPPFAATTTAVLRGRVSDRITCVDLHSLDGERYKYLLMCGTDASIGEQLGYLYALESDGRGALMQWAQLDPWLLGGRLFGVLQAPTGGGDVTDDFKVVAVDSKGVLQCRCADDDFAVSTRVVCETTASKVLRLSCRSDYVTVGHADGTVSDNRKAVLMRLNGGPVTFLQCLSERLVVAGTPHSFQIGTLPVQFPSTQVRQCYALGADDAWLLLVKETAAFQVFDMRAGEFVQCDEEQLPVDGQQHLAGCDLVDECMAMATTVGELHVWSIAVDATGLLVRRRPDMQKRLLAGRADGPPVCVKLSVAHQFVAVGFQGGAIQLYRMSTSRVQFVQSLHAHRTAVRALLFAPWPLLDACAQPLVLASVAGEMSFWDVTHADNNRPLDGAQPLRQSGRFPNRPVPVTPEEDDGRTVFRNEVLWSDDVEQRRSMLPWSGRQGDPRKPALLACIKFIGGVAEQLFANAAFTKFLTIDDAGEIYHFELREWPKHARPSTASPMSVPLADDGSSMSPMQTSPSFSSLEDEVISDVEPAIRTMRLARGSIGDEPVLNLSPLNGHYI